jgi:hypothetical protein
MSSGICIGPLRSACTRPGAPPLAGLEACARISHPESTGTLPLRQVDALVALLRPATSTPDRCWFAFGGGERWPTVVDGALEAVHGFAGPPGRQTPAAWWPHDNAWRVTTAATDFATHVRGSRALIARLLDDPRLNAWPAPAPSAAVA